MGERETLREPRAGEVEATEIEPENKSIFPHHGNQTTATVTEGESIVLQRK